jgi:NAD(P)-dependent dehydrogenase (short-subunit alcohol dehydrogenase family)
VTGGGQRVVVTGAAQGIGRAIALGMAAQGNRVACVDIDADGVRDTAEMVSRQGNDAIVRTCDLTDWAAVQAMAAGVAEELGGVDVVVTSAGGSAGDVVHFLDLDPERWDQMIDRNLTSTFYTSLAFARRMVADGRAGAIVCISSQLSEVVRPALAHYCSSKGGVRQLARAMAVDLAEHHIRVNAVAPGPTWTPGTQELFSRPEVRARNEASIPMGRLGQPEDLVGAVAFLASPQSAYVTGATLFVDGGYTIV